MIANETRRYVVEGDINPTLVVRIYLSQIFQRREPRARFRYFFEAEAVRDMLNKQLAEQGTLEGGE